MRRAVAVVLLFAWALPSLAADRHVFLNLDSGTTGWRCTGDHSTTCTVDANCSGVGGVCKPTLNQCPNPAHNTYADASTARKLQYCVGGSFPGKVVGDRSPYVSACTGGTVAYMQSGFAADIDNDGTNEPIYGHPQACGWFMNRGDSCEVHAGVYKRAGAMSDWDVDGDNNTIDRSDCWKASLAMMGFGAGAGIGTQGAGYGVDQAHPAVIEGAVMAGSTDTWDTNGNKTPDSAEGITSYPWVLSGDSNLNGTPMEPTTCTADDVVGGDSYFPLYWGCGHGTSGSVNRCNHSGPQRPMIDTDADGVFDTPISSVDFGSQAPDVSWFTLKNVEATGYNGGPLTCSDQGVREANGNFALNGDEDSSGFIADGIYFHDNAQTNLCRDEHYVTVFSDDENSHCSVDTEIKNSNFKVDNRFWINDDCDADNPGASECGCGWYAHDNRVELMTTPTSAPGGRPCDTTNGGDGSTNGASDWCRKALIRLKSVDALQTGARPKRFRIENNEIINSSTNYAPGWPWLIHTECFGQCDPDPKGWGQFWFNGNIVRTKAGASEGIPFGGYSCSSQTVSGRLLMFNNDFDIGLGAESTRSLGGFCGNDSLERYISRNNAFYRSTSVNTQTATVTSPGSPVSNRCTESGQTGCTQSNANGSGGTPRTNWFTSGAWDASVNAGPSNYLPRIGGPLDGTGTCDPDGDGVAGIDPDGNEGPEANITSWKDIRGNTVNCSNIGNTINIGAVQVNVGGAPVCGNGNQDAGEACDDGNTSNETACPYQITGPNACTRCNSTCTSVLNLTGPYCGDGAIAAGVEACDGTNFGTDSCLLHGFASGTLACFGSCTAVSTINCVASVVGSTKRVLGTIRGGRIGP